MCKKASSLDPSELEVSSKLVIKIKLSRSTVTEQKISYFFFKHHVKFQAVSANVLSPYNYDGLRDRASIKGRFSGDQR